MVAGWIDGFGIVAGWWDGFRMAASTQLVVSGVLFGLLVVIAIVLFVIDRRKNTVVGHRVHWE
jgi:hypothetical protein